MNLSNFIKKFVRFVKRIFYKKLFFWKKGKIAWKVYYGTRIINGDALVEIEEE